MAPGGDVGEPSSEPSKSSKSTFKRERYKRNISWQRCRVVVNAESLKDKEHCTFCHPVVLSVILARQSERNNHNASTKKDASRPFEHGLEASFLFEFYNRYAGFAFAKGAKAVGFYIAGFFEFVMNSGTEFPGSAAVNDSHLI